MTRNKRKQKRVIPAIKKTFIRDGRAPIPKREVTSEIMSSIRGKDTKPELTLRKALFHAGLSGYRLHWKRAFGRPDVCYPGRKIAIFVHGCFWHRCCPYCKPSMPKSNIDFWQEKFKRNVQRDKKKITDLKNDNWRVLIFWECQLSEDLKKCVEKVKNLHKGRIC